MAMSLFSWLLVSLTAVSFVIAVPLDKTSAELNSYNTVIPDYAERYLSQLNRSDYPVLARNALPEDQLPIVELPSGRYRATKYVKDADVYLFKNIRFAAPPTGQLRFAKPQRPARSSSLSDGKYGPQCIQSFGIQQIPNLDIAGLLSLGSSSFILAPILDLVKPVIGEFGRTGVVDVLLDFLNPLLAPGGLLSAFPGTIGDIVEALGGVLGSAASEDCLFLDVFVPGAVIRQETEKPLPVVNWIYGGAYILGTKDGLYDGYGLIKASKGGLVFVQANYRMGAFGFLGGRVAEEANATNLAFYDQRAVLQWIQDFIGQFGGDKNKVTAIGESAGGGSIMHHITAFGGKQDPLFRKAIIQSPAFIPVYDRDFVAEEIFEKFEKNAGCEGKGFDCLRSRSSEDIMKANDETVKSVPPSSFAFGPFADGKWVRQIPGMELYTGNFYQGLESIIVTHTTEEPSIFLNPNITTQAQLDEFIAALLPANPPTLEVLETHQKKFPTVKARLRDLIQGAAFACNARYLVDAFGGKAFSLQYSLGRGTHGSDIIPTFYSSSSPITSLAGIINSDIPKASVKLQAYFSNYITTGDPNSELSVTDPSLFNLFPSDNLPLTRPDPSVDTYKVVDISTRDSMKADVSTGAEQCDFWKNTIALGTGLIGMAPPGAALQSSLGSVSEPSKYYFSPRPARDGTVAYKLE